MVQLPAKEHHIYCDESYTTATRFMVYGGIVLRDRDVKWFEDLMAAWRVRNKTYDELKWKKASNEKYAQYQSLVDFYFKNRHRDGLHFKSMVCDTQSADYVAFARRITNSAI